MRPLRLVRGNVAFLNPAARNSSKKAPPSLAPATSPIAVGLLRYEPEGARVSFMINKRPPFGSHT